MVDWVQDVQSRLRVVETMCEGAMVSLWACRGEALDGVLGDVPGGAAALGRLWHGARLSLTQGRIVAQGGLTLVPLRATRRLTGVLVVAGPFPEDDMSRIYIDMLARRLGSQLARPPQDRLPLGTHVTPGSKVPRGHSPRPGRDNLMCMFDRARGNLTLVADWLGVTRQTVYNYLQSYGIPAHERPRRRPRGAI